MDDDDQDLRQMGVEDLLAFLGGLVGGPAADVEVDLPFGDDDWSRVASFSGIVSAVREGEAPAGAIVNLWRVFFEHDRRTPSAPVLTVDPRLFRAADFDGETLRARLMNARVEIRLYV
jgi:hypothetical protein